MDPVMYTASSQLERPERNRTDATEDFYQTHGHLPVWSRFAGLVAAAYRKLRALLKAPSIKVIGNRSLPARMVR